MDTSFPLIATWLGTYKYVLIFPLTILHGPLTMMVSGFLLRLDYFSFFPLYLALLAADFVGDLLWYAVGYHGARSFFEKYGKFISVSAEMLTKLEGMFQTHRKKILFISKITMGFGPALLTLVAAGMARIPLKEYALFNILGGFIWVGLLMGIGYFFGDLYVLIDRGFRTAFLVVISILVLAVLFGVGRFFKRKILKNHA